jgi:hemerythrin-like domain-containing protein
MNLLTLLTQDHRNLTALFARVPATVDDPAEANHLATLISEQLSRHAAVEEQLLYPALLAEADAGEDRLLVLKALEDHHAAEQTLLEALSIAPNDERLVAKLMLLAEVVPRHAEHEEEVLFDVARRVLTHTQLEEMGEQAEALKKVAPTRPHPHLTGRPLWQMALVLPIAVADRAVTTVRQLAGAGLGFLPKP